MKSGLKRSNKFGEDLVKTEGENILRSSHTSILKIQPLQLGEKQINVD